MTPARRVVPVACLSCGTVAWVYVTVTPLRQEQDGLLVRIVPDPDDLVMLQLFARAHRGPLVRRC